MCKKKKTDEPKKRRNGWFGLTIAAVILTFILSAGTLVALACIYQKDPTHFAGAAEAALLSNGLALIGLAIAVWTGMNISNAIQRKEVDSLQDRVDELSRTSGQLKETSQAVARTLSYLDAESLFLQEILKTGGDYTSVFLYYAFQSESRIKADWDSLIQIERLFTQVQKMYKGSITEAIPLRTVANLALQKINDLQPTDHPTLKRYLIIRKADFHYYMGYVSNNPKQVYDHYRQTIDLYIDWLNVLGVELEDIESIDKMTTPVSRNMVAHIANGISLSYIKIAQMHEHLEKKGIADDIIQSSGKQAVLYGEYAKAWAKTSDLGKDEFIFRNLGAAYEWRDILDKTPFASKNKVIGCNKEAFNKMVENGSVPVSRIRKVYYALFSYYKKYLESALEIENILGGGIDATKLPDELPNDVATLLQNFIRYSDYALSDGHKYGFVINLNGFAYCYAALAEKVRNIPIDGVTYQECLEKAQSALDMLELIGRTDGDNEVYYNQLQKCYKFLQEHYPIARSDGDE